METTPNYDRPEGEVTPAQEGDADAGDVHDAPESDDSEDQADDDDTSDDSAGPD